MNQRPLRSLAQAAFAADEHRLFLDTHPCDERALEAYRAAAQQAEQAKNALPFGVNAMDAGKCGQWDWVQTPWPWELEG